MCPLTPDQWKLLSPRLDDALGMTTGERSNWLAELRTQNPNLARQLETLLHEHGMLLQEGFLDEPSTQLPGSQSIEGQTVGVYTLVSEIGHGGMGSVWLAERNDGRFERRVAVKFLNLGSLGRSAEQRFKREGSILARLAHPHIAELVDASVTAAGQPYLVLEYVSGEHIDHYCDRLALDVASRIRLVLDVLAAVSHAHNNLIVHCDIKPSNVLVRTDGQVKLLDFGIAKLIAEGAGSDETTLLTIEGMRPMTPEYAAPEQLQGGQVTTSTDVYALGVLLYVLLTGQHPVGNGPHSPADLVKAVVDKEPARPSDAVSQTESGAARATTNALRRATTPDRLHRALRGDLDTIVAKALKKEPRERYSSVAALAEDLRRYLRNQPITARPDTFTYRAAKFVRRHRLPVLLASLAVAATIAGALGTMVQARTARSQRDFALRQLVRAERINDLNQLLLTDVAPSGKMLTANQLLDHEKQIIEREHYDNAANHVEMLLSIGSQYSGEEENEKALAVLSQAYQLSRQLHEPSTRARASCELASASIPGGELVRAESLIQEGLRELPNQPQYELDRVSCLVSGSETAFRNGNASHAVARAEAADRALKGAPVQPPVEELDVSTALASAYGAASRFREANSSFERASLQMTNLGYDETQKAVKLYNDWGLTLFDAGRPLEAEKAYRRAIQISRSDQTEDSVLPTLLHNYSTTLRELGRLDEAADYAGRAHQKALQDGNQILAVQTALQQARIYRDQHDFARATAILAEAEPKMKQALPPGHYAFAVLAHDKAGLAREQGQGAKALELSNQAIAIDEASIKAGGQGASYLPTFLTRRSAIELDAGNSDRAVADAARALELLRSTMEPGTLSSTLGRTNLALARALQAQGKVEEARAAFQSAAENLQATIGRDHPDTRAALQSAHSDNQHSQLAAGNAKS